MVTSKAGKRHALTGFEALRDLFMLRSDTFLSIDAVWCLDKELGSIILVQLIF